MRFLQIAALIGSIVLLGLAVGFFYLSYQFKTSGPLRQDKIIVLEPGIGVRGMASRLTDEGVVHAPYPFMIWSKLAGVSGRLQAGEYQFPAHVTVAGALRMIADGRVYRRAVTIPEGLTSFEIVQIINSTDGMTGTITDIPPEGSLLPDTYDFTGGMNRGQMVKRMQDSMRAVLDEAWAKRDPTLPLKDLNDAVTLASIVEKETGVASERARIAGVFINRLRQGMMLQTDPTVIYAITKGRPQSGGQGPIGRRLLRTDLEMDSPYNTYKIAGLPPGPIANPGKAAILATLRPETHDFLYFVADGTGGHAFAKTLDHHNQNAATWRAIRSRAEDQSLSKP